MHLQPSPTWYLDNADGAEPVRLLDDGGRAEPALSGTPHGVLAELPSWTRPSTRRPVTSPKPSTQLRDLELFVALPRWRR
jgi:hypothetical protein